LLLIVCFLFEESKLSELLVSEPECEELFREVELVVDVDKKETGEPVLDAVDAE
jgi:hypothetical protein